MSKTKIMLTCKDASRLQSQAQDRRLGFAERLGLRLHLLICEGCRAFRRQLSLLRQAGGQIDKSCEIEVKGKALSADAKARILREMESEQRKGQE